MERQRIIVTGGAGFLGAHLCRRLLTDGHDVLCVDNVCSGSGDSLRDLAGRPRFRLLRHDVTRPLHARADRVYNLACPASPLHYQTDPILTAKTNFLGTLNALELARRCGARLFQASTSEVYGDPGMHPQDETYRGNVNPIGPRACYDEGKRCAEALCFDFRRVHGVDVKVARIFNTYGPGMRPDDGRVVSNFIVQALRNAPITLYGDGEQTRSFCYVDDMIDGFVRFMDSGACGPINLGNPVEIPIGVLATTIRALTGSRSRIELNPLPSDDPSRRRPDIRQAQRVLGWTPRVRLDTGLERTIAYFDDLLRRPRNATLARSLAPAAAAP